MNKKVKTLTLITSGIIFTYILFQSYHFDNIFQIFFFIIFGELGLYLFCNGIFDEIETFKKTKSLKNSYITFFGALLIILNLGIYCYYEIKIKSPTLLKVENSFYADFKKNGEYIIKCGSWASQKHFYGNYIINDSILTLDKRGFSNQIISNRFVIRAC